MNRTNDPELLQLPIDQYSRQQWVAFLADVFRPSGGSFKILDVGGYKGKTADFHPQDEVWVCDLFDVEAPHYVKGDGRRLPFEDASFDLVVSFDTYEHVPRDGRRQFISELNRVAKIGAIVAAPFDETTDGPTSKAEVSLNQYHQELYGTPHRWLQEHIDFKIPLKDELDELLRQAGLDYTSFKTNDLSLWALTQYIYFSIELDDELRGRVDDLNRLYSRSFPGVDATDGLAYRRIYFFSKASAEVQKIQNFIKSHAEPDLNAQLEYLKTAIYIFGRKYADVVRHSQYLNDRLTQVENAAATKTHRSLRRKKS